MKILITGAAGGIGGELAKTLGSEHEVFAMVRRTSRTGHLPSSVQLIEGDLTDPESLARAVAGMDAVVHSAVSFQPSQMQKVNVDGTRDLVNAARDAGCKLFVFVSSMAVYSSLPNITHYTEDLDLPVAKGLDAYSRTKLLGEKLVTEACRGSQMAFLIVRPTIVLGDRIAAWYTGILDLMKVLPVQFFGTNLDIIDVEDLTKTVALLVAKPATYNQIYNLGGFDVGARDYFSMLGTVLGRRILALPRWLTGFLALFVPACLWFFRRDLIIDSTKVRSATGFEPQTTLESYRDGRSRRVFFPTNIPEIIVAWRECRRSYTTIGGAYSYLLKNSRPPVPAIHLKKFNRILSLDGNQITVEAGTPIYQILDYLDERGLTMATMPEFLGASAGAALITPVHGSSIEHSGTAHLASRIKYLDNGTVEVRERGQPGFADLIYNPRLHVIFLEVTFDCVEQYLLERRITWTDDSDFETVMEKNFRENHHCTMEWYPDHHQVMTFKINKVEPGRKLTRVPFYLHHTPYIFNRWHPADVRKPSVNKSHRIMGPWTHLGSFGRFAAALATNQNVEFALPLHDMPTFISEMKALLAQEKKPLYQLGFRCGGTDGLPHSAACEHPVVWVELVLQTAFWLPKIQKIIDTMPHRFHTGKYQF